MSNYKPILENFKTETKKILSGLNLDDIIKKIDEIKVFPFNLPIDYSGFTIRFLGYRIIILDKGLLKKTNPEDIINPYNLYLMNTFFHEFMHSIKSFGFLSKFLFDEIYAEMLSYLMTYEYIKDKKEIYEKYRERAISEFSNIYGKDGELTERFAEIIIKGYEKSYNVYLKRKEQIKRFFKGFYKNLKKIRNVSILSYLVSYNLLLKDIINEQNNPIILSVSHLSYLFLSGLMFRDLAYMENTYKIGKVLGMGITLLPDEKRKELIKRLFYSKNQKEVREILKEVYYHLKNKNYEIDEKKMVYMWLIYRDFYIND